jgi:Na+/H+ antiporter NhaC
MSIIAIFSLYYPNVCAKYNEEILIAQRTTPQKDENHNREVIKKTIKKNKSRRDNKLFWYFLILFFLLFVILIGYNVYTITNKNAISNWFILTELGLLLLIASIRYLIAQYRVEEFKLSIRKVET